MTINRAAYVAWATQSARRWESTALQFLDDLDTVSEDSRRATRTLELVFRDQINAKLQWLVAVMTILEKD